MFTKAALGNQMTDSAVNFYNKKLRGKPDESTFGRNGCTYKERKWNNSAGLTVVFKDEIKITLNRFGEKCYGN